MFDIESFVQRLVNLKRIKNNFRGDFDKNFVHSSPQPHPTPTHPTPPHPTSVLEAAGFKPSNLRLPAVCLTTLLLLFFMQGCLYFLNYFIMAYVHLHAVTHFLKSGREKKLENEFFLSQNIFFWLFLQQFSFIIICVWLSEILQAQAI